MLTGYLCDWVYQLLHLSVSLSLFCSSFFISSPLSSPLPFLSVSLLCLAACLGRAFAHKQVSIMSAESGQTMGPRDRGAGREGERRCRKDAEEKVKALVRAGIIYTASCCFLLVRHVREKHSVSSLPYCVCVCVRRCMVFGRICGTIVIPKLLSNLHGHMEINKCLFTCS